MSNRKIFELPIRSINKENPDQNLLWFNNNTFHHLTEWLANELQKTILRYYFNKKDHHLPLKHLRKYMQQNEATQKVMHLTQITLKQIGSGLVDRSQVELDALRIFQEKLKQDYENRIMDLNDDSSKRKRRRKGRQKKPHSQEKQIIVENVRQSDLPKNEEVELPALTTVSDLNKKTQQEPLIQKNSSLNVKLEDINPQINSLIKSISKISQKTCSCEQFIEEEQDKTQKTLIGGQIFQQLEQKDDQCDQILTQVMSSQALDQKKKKRRRKNGKNINKVVEEFKAKATHSLLNKQLDKLLDTLSTQSNSTYESKVIAFERVRYFVKSMYPYSEAVLFGSNAVGLSLPTSDIDIMLLDLNFSTREELCDYLAHIEVFINSMGWITSCSSYLNAKVPLLKLEIDTSINYLTPKIKLDYHQTYDPYLSRFLDLKDPSKAAVIKVDIIISTDAYRASPSTELMRNWLYQKPSLQRVLLALKYTLAVRGYSQNFKGGIGSYCLFIMVAAYFQYFNEQRQQSDCQILLDVLKFYGEQFENHLKMITLATESQLCYISNEQALKSVQITEQLIFNNSLKIIDPLNNNLMSSSCYQYSSIKTEWRKIREEIMKITQKIEIQISSSFTNTLQVSKMLLNQKAFDKWVNRLQGRIDSSVESILEGKF